MMFSRNEFVLQFQADAGAYAVERVITAAEEDERASSLTGCDDGSRPTKITWIAVVLRIRFLHSKVARVSGSRTSSLHGPAVAASRQPHLSPLDFGESVRHVLLRLFEHVTA